MTDNHRVEMIPAKNIHPNPDNPRFEAGDVTGLAASIGEESILQNLLVIPAPEFGEDHYLLLDGYRRWVAGNAAGLELPCMVLHPDPNENLAIRALIIGLITDVHKVPLTHMERAKAYGRLRDEASMTQAEIGKRVGLTPGTISRYLALLQLSDKSQRHVREGKLSVDKAVQAVQKNRARNRQQEGKKPIDVGWEPDHFSTHHHLARKAAVMCEAREHGGRRRLGGACGACWETVIRQDQTRVLRVEYENAGAVLPDFLAPISPDGAIRTNGVRGAQ